MWLNGTGIIYARAYVKDNPLIYLDEWPKQLVSESLTNSKRAIAKVTTHIAKAIYTNAKSLCLGIYFD
jgi:hypothetical protein